MNLWNFTIDDTSPYLSYSPNGNSPDTSNGWRTWYSISQFNKVANQVAEGDSFHVTSATNASVTLQFTGTGIALYGFSNCSSFDISIDDGQPTIINTLFPSNSLLYSNHALSNGTHSVTLRPQPSNASQSLAFDSAIVSTPYHEIVPSPLFFDASSKTQSIVYSGTWSSVSQVGVPNTTVSAPFRKTTENGASVSFTFTGASAVAVKGPVNSENGLYSVSLDDSTTTLNAISLYIVPDALLYFSSGLDPASTHRLTMTNLDSSLNLNSITTYSQNIKDNVATATSSKKPINIGLILGPALGVVFLLFLGIFLWYRRNLLRPRTRMPTQILTFTKPKDVSRKVIPIRSRRSPSSVEGPPLPIVTKRSTPRGRRVYDLDSDLQSETSSTKMLNANPAYYRQGMHFDESSDGGHSYSGPGSTSTHAEGVNPYRNPSLSDENYGYTINHSQSPNSATQFTKHERDERRVTVSSSSTNEHASSRVTSRPLPVPPHYGSSLRTPESMNEDRSISEIHFNSDVGSERYASPPPGYAL